VTYKVPARARAQTHIAVQPERDAVHVHCRCDRERRGAVQRSRRGAQGYHYGGSRHSLLIAGFQHKSQTNERTNERTLAASLARHHYVFRGEQERAAPRERERERDRGKKTEKEKKREKERENGHCISVYMSCMCMYKFAARWRMCAHGRGCQRGQSIESRAYLFLYLSFFPFSFFFYFHKYTSQLFDVSQLIFWRKAPKHVDEK